jgi:hypothetical protein
MNILQQPLLMASASTDNSLGLEIFFFLIAVPLIGVALQAGLHRARRAPWAMVQRRKAGGLRQPVRIESCPGGNSGCPAH